MAAVGEDSSRQDMKKNMRWERIEDAEGMRSRADLNRDRGIQSPVITVTPALDRGLHPVKKDRKKHRGS